MNPDLNVGESIAASLSPTGLRTISKFELQWSNLVISHMRVIGFSSCLEKGSSESADIPKCNVSCVFYSLVATSLRGLQKDSR